MTDEFAWQTVVIVSRDPTSLPALALKRMKY
jgi:hypothetical protein